MDLTMIVPSRGRPKQAEAVRDSFLRTTSANTRLVFALDKDDATARNYSPFVFQSNSTSVVSALNNAARTYMGDSRYLGFTGDDGRFITEGWDKIMVAAADEQGGGIVYANDLMDPGALPTEMIMSSSIVKALGFMAPPVLQLLCFDDFWLQLGKGIGKIKYLDDVVIQHISLPGPQKPNNDFELWRGWQQKFLAQNIETAKCA